MPLVVTVHDLAVLRHPELFTAWTRLYARTLLPPVLRAADRVLASPSSRSERSPSSLGVPEERLRVAPNATTDAFSPDGPAAEGDYVLAVGTLEPRKNLARLVEATRRLGVQLRVAGARGWGGVELDDEHVTWLGRLDDDQLAALYRGAHCLAYPSLYEGFGIPVLEAMALRGAGRHERGNRNARRSRAARPSSSTRSTPPRSPPGSSVRCRGASELRAAGLERARAFTWEATAEATAAVYEELA